MSASLTGKLEFKLLNFEEVELKEDDEGRGIIRAVIATLDTPDRGGDITLPGAINKGATVRISPWNHASALHGSPVLPVGDGKMEEEDNKLVLSGRYYGDDESQKVFERVKAMGKKVEWSHAFFTKKVSYDDRDGKTYRLLKKLHAFEVSPVIIAEGVGTRTLTAKLLGLGEGIAGSVEPSPEQLQESKALLAQTSEHLSMDFGFGRTL